MRRIEKDKKEIKEEQHGKEGMILYFPHYR